MAKKKSKQEEYLFEVTTIENGQQTLTEIYDYRAMCDYIRDATDSAQIEPLFVVKVIPNPYFG